MIYKYVEKHV